MAGLNKLIKVISFVLVGAGVVLLGVNIVLGGTLNLALPLVFMMLGVAFYLLVLALYKKWIWALFLFVPGSILLAFGLILLLNVITKDWNSWAYAWLLLLAGAGLGLVLANWQQNWPHVITLVGWGLVAGGVTLFAVLGAIAGGLFIQVMAPILLVLGGLLLLGLRPESLLPENILRRFRPAAASLTSPKAGQAASPDQSSLVEPLSARELEVLHLVEQGLTNSEIARRLVLAPSTVKTHINNIYGKLGVQTRTQALKRARELGLLNQ